jgi:hypothetical protein
LTFAKYYFFQLIINNLVPSFKKIPISINKHQRKNGDPNKIIIIITRGGGTRRDDHGGIV